MGHVSNLLSGPDADRAAVEATLRGDQDAFGVVVARHKAAIAAQMWAYTRDPAAHEELVHDVFVEAFRGLSQFDWRSPLLHWLRRIGARVGMRSRRRRRRAVTTLSLDTRDQQLERRHSFAGTRASERLHELLESLSERDRLVLSLLYWQKCSVADAAEIAGWSPTMIRVQAYRARQKLRRAFNDDAS